MEDNPILDRRTILESSATFGAVGLLSPSVSGRGRNNKSRVSVITGTPNNPVSKADVIQCQRKGLQAYKTDISAKASEKDVKYPNATAMPVFDHDEDMYVSDYIYKVGDDGSGMTYIGYRSSKDNSHSTIRSRGISSDAETHKRIFNNSDNSKEAKIQLNESQPAGSQFSTSNQPGGGLTIGGSWDAIGGLFTASAEKDCNKIYHNSYLCHYNGGIENTDHELWSMAGEYRIAPEEHRCPGNWIYEDLDSFKVKHKYKKSDFDEKDVKSVGPDGYRDGRVTGKSINLGLSADGPSTGIQYSYDQPKIVRKELTNNGAQNRGVAGWEFTDPSEDIDGEPREYTLGSSWWMEDHPPIREETPSRIPGITRKCMGENVIRAIFDSYVTVETNLSVPIEYYVNFEE